MEHMIEAPNFTTQSNYPLGGERIGPAWRMAWEQLSPAAWVSGRDIATHVIESGINIQNQTVRLLMWKAERAGILISRKVSRRTSNGARVFIEYKINVDSPLVTCKNQSSTN